MSRKLLRNYLCRWDAPCGEPFDAAKLIMFEALYEPCDAAADKNETSREEYISSQLSVVSSQLSVVSCQLSVVSSQLSVVSCQLS
ncbi:MAG: hypothetical protein ABIO91_07560, partial [Pyrinomonadaceae bacterium]